MNRKCKKKSLSKMKVHYSAWQFNLCFGSEDRRLLIVQVTQTVV